MSGPSRWQRLAVTSYPPSFRERYGDELTALCEDTGPGIRSTADLALGSLRLWLSPSYGPDPVERRRWRLQSTAATVWVCACTVLAGTAATLRLQVDGPPPGFDPTTGAWAVANNAAGAAIVLAAVLVALAGAWLGFFALREGGPAVRRVAIAPVVCGLVCVVAMVPFAWYSSRHDLIGTSLPLWFALGGLAWLLLVMVTAVWGTLAMPYALRLAALPADRLRPAVVVGVPVALALLVPATLLVAVALRVGDAWGSSVTVVTTVSTVAVAAAAVVALVSVVRGLKAAPHVVAPPA
ncbi:MAG: hypothetical protein ABI468_02635 [Candidatus Nanopelagicales bacterium]